MPDSSHQLRSPSPHVPVADWLLPEILAVNRAILGMLAEPEPSIPAAGSRDSELDFTYRGGPLPFPARQAMMSLISTGLWITTMTSPAIAGSTIHSTRQTAKGRITTIFPSA